VFEKYKSRDTYFVIIEYKQKDETLVTLPVAQTYFEEEYSFSFSQYLERCSISPRTQINDKMKSL